MDVVYVPPINMWMTLPAVATTGCSVYCIFFLMVAPEKTNCVKVDGLGSMHVIRNYQVTNGQVLFSHTVSVVVYVCMLFMSVACLFPA